MCVRERTAERARSTRALCCCSTLSRSFLNRCMTSDTTSAYMCYMVGTKVLCWRRQWGIYSILVYVYRWVDSISCLK